MATVDTKTLSQEGTNLFCKKKNPTDSAKKFSETDVKMLEFLIDNIFVMFGRRVFQQTVSIPVGINCDPLLADLFLHSQWADFIQSLLTKNEKKLADPLFSRSTIQICSLVFLLIRIYPIVLEIKDTTVIGRSALNIDLHLEIDSEGWLRTKLYDKGDDYNFPIVNFPFIYSNIPAASPNGVLIAYISELVVPIRISLIEGFCIKCSFWLS